MALLRGHFAVGMQRTKGRTLLSRALGYQHNKVAYAQHWFPFSAIFYKQNDTPNQGLHGRRPLTRQLQTTECGGG